MYLCFNSENQIFIKEFTKFCHPYSAYNKIHNSSIFDKIVLGKAELDDETLITISIFYGYTDCDGCCLKSPLTIFNNICEIKSFPDEYGISEIIEFNLRHAHYKHRFPKTTFLEKVCVKLDPLFLFHNEDRVQEDKALVEVIKKEIEKDIQKQHIQTRMKRIFKSDVENIEGFQQFKVVFEKFKKKFLGINTEKQEKQDNQDNQV